MNLYYIVAKRVEGNFMVYSKINTNAVKDNIQFVIYNHIFSKRKYIFTESQLLHELEQYNLFLSEEDIRDIIKEFMRTGLLYQYNNCFAARK